MAKLGELLEEARERKGLSKEAAAAALRTTPPTYRGWLRGQMPEIDRIPILSDFTGIPEGDIVLALLSEAKGLLLSSLVPTAA